MILIPVCAGLMHRTPSSISFVVDCSAVEPGDTELLDRFCAVHPHSSVLVLTLSMTHPLCRRFPVLRKPFTDEMLLQCVNRLLEVNEIEHERSKAEAWSGVCA